INLSILKASYSKGIVSLRYDYSIKHIIKFDQITSPFTTQLKTDGYKELLNSENKIIYQNKKYKVIIFSEFDYLIVVMVKL
ncbi:MAG: hypothetical protein GX758_03805, partial [Tenericutes bacterium]|nr:hypothetical protein [Mycoplasmatota bacterium]